MTNFTLILHVLAGLAGIILLTALLYQLVHPAPSANRVRSLGWWAWISMVISWVTVAYYYIVTYGQSVKPVIKAGAFPWAHTVLMEAKEHLFLFVPFLTFAIALTLHTAATRLERNIGLRRSLFLLVSVTIVIAALVTLFGVGVSGAYRPS